MKYLVNIIFVEYLELISKIRFNYQYYRLFDEEYIYNP